MVRMPVAIIGSRPSSDLPPLFFLLASSTSAMAPAAKPRALVIGGQFTGNFRAMDLKKKSVIVPRSTSSTHQVCCEPLSSLATLSSFARQIVEFFARAT